MSVTKYIGTTIICVRKNNDVVMAGDGQVTLGHQIIKNSANKLRTIMEGNVLVGFAGATADALALYELLEENLQKQDQYDENNLERSVVELSKRWRTDQMLRKLEAMMIVADRRSSFILTGIGDVLSPEKDLGGEICTIGSGGGYALAAGKALINFTNLTAEEIAIKALAITARICIHTNDNISSIKIGGQNDVKDT